MSPARTVSNSTRVRTGDVGRASQEQTPTVMHKGLGMTLRPLGGQRYAYSGAFREHATQQSGALSVRVPGLKAAITVNFGAGTSAEQAVDLLAKKMPPGVSVRVVGAADHPGGTVVFELVVASKPQKPATVTRAAFQEIVKRELGAGWRLVGAVSSYPKSGPFMVKLARGPLEKTFIFDGPKCIGSQG